MKKALAMGLVLALAAMAAYAVNVFVGDQTNPGGQHTTTYEGTAQLSRDEFVDFKRFIGQPGVTLRKLAINNNQTEPITVEFIFDVPDGMESPYGKRSAGGKNATAMAAGVGVFVVVTLIGGLMVNLKGMDGKRWGRH